MALTKTALCFIKIKKRLNTLWKIVVYFVATLKIIKYNFPNLELKYHLAINEQVYKYIFFRFCKTVEDLKLKGNYQTAILKKNRGGGLVLSESK